MNCSVRVCDVMSRRSSVQDFMDRKISKVFAYPQNDIREVAKIMSDTKIDFVPVLFSPWNKKLVGFIEFKKVSSFLND